MQTNIYNTIFSIFIFLLLIFKQLMILYKNCSQNILVNPDNILICVYQERQSDQSATINELYLH